jgi:hypothetical protein
MFTNVPSVFFVLFCFVFFSFLFRSSHMALELMVQGDTKKYELIFEIFFK